ncbi:replication protein [Serratia odorifera]|uniref:replication protein n=1 Tax=Serratia odorifera TaxID=618 RepID=UPI003D289CAC
MADTDDGYTRIANELLEAVMSADLTARQLKVSLAIIRKTYGFGKKVDRITNTQIASMTGIHHTHVCTAKNEMIAMNIVITSGSQIGINKVVSDWKSIISQDGKSLAKSANKRLANVANEHSPTQLNTKETLQKKERKNTQTHEVGLSEEKLTPRQKGTNPRAKVTNPRSAMPAFDRDRLKDTWNCKAEKYGLPKIRNVSTTVENGLKRLWQSYMKQCKELGSQPNEIDTFLNGYLAHGYTPTKWACGDNPEGKRYGIETALRQEKIDEILSRED